ncbi:MULTISPECIES: SDR family oxidoreductase [Bacillus]|uniref:SDR family oxidoreductase n=1 Tax=Bacillus TaxID=1386 RepID=UPI000BB8087F|nr:MULTISPECIES: SDR family oxidoreductase [Bacillus]
MKNKTVVITGASGGFGLLFVQRFLKDGWNVIATVRNEHKEQDLLKTVTERFPNLMITHLDVSKDDSVKQFQLFMNNYHRVDLLINNAGFAVGGFTEDVSIEEYKMQFEVNFLGVIRVTNVLLPIMRKQKTGKIVNISSISGVLGLPSISAYAASKHALEGYSESLRLEVKPFGIDVALIEPGSYSTNIWTTGTYFAKKYEKENLSVYSSMLTRIQAQLQKNNSKLSPPNEVADVVLKISRMKRLTRLRYPVGSSAKWTIFFKKILPWFIWERIILHTLYKK